MRSFFKAFTLSELLIALGIIGVLCTIMIPAVNSIVANQNKMYLKKAYKTVSEIVVDMLSDSTCYPDKTFSSTGKRIGFDDYAAYTNCVGWGLEKPEGLAGVSNNDWKKILGNDDEGLGASKMRANARRKFQTLFANKLKIKYKYDSEGKKWAEIKSDADHNQAIALVRNNGSVKTDDNMVWQIRTSNKENIVAQINIFPNGEIVDGEKAICNEKACNLAKINVYMDGSFEFAEENDFLNDILQINNDITE